MKKIAVIGGGISGITSTACLKEVGLEPVCFELTDKPGGTWCYREEPIVGVGSVMPTTIINHSKEMGAFSDFPPRKEFNNYMRHSEIYEYFMEYAAKKDVLRHFRYNSEVTSVTRSVDYESTGKWTVTVRDTLSGKVTTDTYDGVLICVGHINRPKMPTYSNQEKFKGKIMHTHSLKRVEEFRDKTVVVVGLGCSGADAATEISTVAKQVYLSTRSGAHVINRVSVNGLPFDTVLLRRYLAIVLELFPSAWAGWLATSLLMDPFFDHRLYSVPPKGHLFSKDPVFNDQLKSKLLSGTIIEKQGLKEFTENGVIFEEESDERRVDVVIMATGYTWEFPFLEDGIVVYEDNMLNLYKCSFPYHLPHATLGVIGFLLPWGPGFPVMELQCRWVAQVLSGRAMLPPKDEMTKDVVARYNRSLIRYGLDKKTSVRVDVYPFMDDLASQFGAKPNLLKMFFTDFKLFYKLWFGPFVAYQYRLQGPHAWGGAREAIMTCEDRILWPLKKGNDLIEHDGFFMRLVKKVLKLIFIYSL